MLFQVSPDERRAFEKKAGTYRPANADTSEKPLLLTSTGTILEQFKPKESESGMSKFLTKEVHDHNSLHTHYILVVVGFLSVAVDKDKMNFL